MATNYNIKLEPLPFEEAITFFRNKVPMNLDQFIELERSVQAMAFTVSDYSSVEIINDIFNELDKAMTVGSTLEEFRAGVNEKMLRRGWTGLTPYRADNIFRTNVQTAYQAGRYKQQTDPDVVQDRPYLTYSAVSDSRTRPSHLALNGVTRRYDDPFWDTWYPPNGFRCRCSVRSLSQRQIDKLKIKVQTGPAPGLVEVPGGPAVPLLPDPYFDYNPGKVFWNPDLSKFPSDLREVYENRRQARQAKK